MTAAWRIGWKVGLAAWICVVLVFFFAVRPFSIPSAAMIPTLWQGDYVGVSTTAYGISKYSLRGQLDLFEGRFFARAPRRGDVVVFAHPRDPKTSYVKRIIGLPGDTVQMKAGRLYLNGDLVPREPAPKVKTDDMYGKEVEVPTWTETLPGGASHTIVEIEGDQGFYDKTDLFKVPADNLFVMGDNRDNSTDSRLTPDQGGVGYVPLDNLIGRVDAVIFSTASKGPGVGPRRVR